MRAAAQLSDEYEYCLLAVGQSNLRMWGERDAGYTAAPHLALPARGKDLTVITVAPLPSTASPTEHGAVGTRSRFTVSEALVPDFWRRATLRLWQADWGDPNESYAAKGVARVLANDVGTIDVEWVRAWGANTASPLQVVSAFLVFEDRWTGYSNVRVLTPYQPELPDPFPATSTPTSPGMVVPASITSFADVGRLLPWCWDEGIDGPCAQGAGTIAGLVLTRTGGGVLVDSLYEDGWLRIGQAGVIVARGRVTANTTTTVTVAAWEGSPPTGVAISWEVSVPHWRDNPNEIGFRYPNGDMQPGGWLNGASTGVLYSRASGNLVSNYIGKAIVDGTVRTTLNASGLAQRVASSSGSMTASLSGGKLRIDCSSTTNTTGETQFAAFVRRNHLVRLAGWATQDINYTWRVDALVPGPGLVGGYVDLVAVPVADGGIPGGMPASITATCVVGSSLTRRVSERRHKFGPVLELAWRMATALQKRVNVVLLAINSTGLQQASGPVREALADRMGWWDPHRTNDWHIGNADGLANRLLRMLTVMLPAALLAEGNPRKARVLGTVMAQGETEALVTSGRERYFELLDSWHGWLRSALEAAGLSGYAAGVAVPVCHWSLPSSPWQIVAPGFNGDAQGLVNTAIRDWTALAKFAGTITTEAAPKVGDGIHFDAVGSVQNAKASAAVLLDLVDRALSVAGMGYGALDICNAALRHVGESRTITSLDGQDTSYEAELCRTLYPRARQALMDLFPWSWCRRRAALKSVTNTRSEYAWAYAMPADALRIDRIVPPGTPDDMGAFVDVVGHDTDTQALVPQLDAVSYVVETNERGYLVVRTHVANAEMLYRRLTVDARDWSPLFVQALEWYLAMQLAAPIIKGDRGRQEAANCSRMALGLARQAASADANQRLVKPVHEGGSMRARR